MTIEGKRRPVGTYIQNKTSELTGIPVMPYTQDPDKVLTDLDNLLVKEFKIMERTEISRKSNGSPF